MVATTTSAPVRISANHTATKWLGNWTTAREFQVRPHRGHAVLDLRSPQIPAGDLSLELDLDHALLTVLVADDATLDDWDLQRVGRGRVKDWQGPNAPAGRRIVLTGQRRKSEIRVHRGGIAILSAMCSREYLDDLRPVHRHGGFPTVDDPTRTA